MSRWFWGCALLVLVLGVGVWGSQHTEVGSEALRLVREDFHNRTKMKNAFQVSSKPSAEYEDLSDGTFVKVKFTMKQTNCKRQKWMSPDCAPIMTSKRTLSCLGCFTFSPGRVLLRTGYQKCVRQIQARKKEVKIERRKACGKLRGKKPQNIVGAYSFQRAPRGHYNY